MVHHYKIYRKPNLLPMMELFFGSQERSTVGTGYVKVELVFLVVWILSIVWRLVGTNLCIEILLWHKEVHGTIIGALERIPLVTYDGIYIGMIEWPTDRTYYG